MEDIKLYLSIAIFIIGLITSTISIILKYTKNKKVKNNLENILSIINELIPLIEEAEKFSAYSGEEKKEYVTSRMIMNLKNSNQKIEEEKINEMIEKLVSFSKEVNYKNKTSLENELKILKEVR